MEMSKRSKGNTSVVVGVVLLVSLWGAAAGAQAGRSFVARLSTVPITVAMQDTVSGRGTASAQLTGRRLTISGTFEGLRSPATVARLHVAPRATRGPAVADLDISKQTSGTVAGAIDLTDRQMQALDEGALYIQIHSEKASEGNLWGWLIPQEAQR